jgi:hypothetical protein
MRTHTTMSSRLTIRCTPRVVRHEPRSHTTDFTRSPPGITTRRIEVAVLPLPWFLHHERTLVGYDDIVRRCSWYVRECSSSNGSVAVVRLVSGRVDVAAGRATSYVLQRVCQHSPGRMDMLNSPHPLQTRGTVARARRIRPRRGHGIAVKAASRVSALPGCASGGTLLE